MDEQRNDQSAEADVGASKDDSEKLVLVARKSAFGLPTACLDCLNVLICLKLAKVPFHIRYKLNNPTSEALPSIEYGDFAAFENEASNIMDVLTEAEIVKIDTGIPAHVKSQWLLFRSLILTHLRDAVLYELWVSSDKSVVDEIYFSDLPWPINKVLHWKQKSTIMQRLGVDSINADSKGQQFYRNADKGYEALSNALQDEPFEYLLAYGPTTLDAILAGHILFVLHVFDDTSSLKQILKKYDALTRYAQDIKTEFLESSSSSEAPIFFSGFAKSSRKDSRNRSSKPKAKKEKTEEEKTFRRRSKYFLITQFVSVIVFLALMGNLGESEFDMEDDDRLISDD